MTQAVTTPVGTDAAIPAGQWRIDPEHSEVSFTVRHFMTKVRGNFTEFAGEITVDAASPLTSTATAEIQLASVDTRNATRDAHLRSSEVLNAEKYPVMRFVTSELRPAGGDRFKLDGELTIHNVIRPVTLDVEFLGMALDGSGVPRISLSAETTINRADFGVTFNIPLGGDRVMLSDEVGINIEVEAVHQGEDR